MEEQAVQKPVLADILKTILAKTKLKKNLESELEQVKSELDAANEIAKEYFIELGVNSMKSEGKTIYLSKQLWAGKADEVNTQQIIKALEILSLDSFLNFNYQSLSGYVREIVKSHPEFIGEQGAITATPEQILSVLPEPLNTLLKVTEKIDIKVRS